MTKNSLVEKKWTWDEGCVHEDVVEVWVEIQLGCKNTRSIIRAWIIERTE